MTRGSRTERPSVSGPACIPILDYSLAAPESRLVSVLESAFLADMAGAGTTGDLTGITTTSLTTTTPTFPTAEFSLITTLSIARMATSIAGEADSRAAVLAEIRASMDQPRSMDLQRPN